VTARLNWLADLRQQIASALPVGAAPHDDTGFDWTWFAGRGPRAAAAPPPGEPFSVEWLARHAEPLGEVREKLADDTSRRVFDRHLLLRCVGPARCHFSRLEATDWLTVHRSEPFRHPELPADYLGLPLEVFEVSMAGSAARFRLVATAMQIRLCNAYRQYVPVRGGVSLGPRPAEVVLDCGACIGDFAVLFAALVGPGGAVHLFDPVPLHLRFCHHQAVLNPGMAAALHPVQAAVGASTTRTTGDKSDVQRISPGGLKVTAYDVTTLDHYIDRIGLQRIDFVKMDIEGAELDALAGSGILLARHRPRLAISAYHRPEHLWEVPRAILAAQPGYRLFFGHHMPVKWESVFYAVHPE
jgi:FkbM family methyltransferase